MVDNDSDSKLARGWTYYGKDLDPLRRKFMQKHKLTETEFGRAVFCAAMILTGEFPDKTFVFQTHLDSLKMLKWVKNATETLRL